MTLERARDEDGQFVGDDPATEENEAWVEKAEQEEAPAPAPAKSPTRTAKQRKAPKNEDQSAYVYFVSANEENAAFDLRINDERVRGYWDENRKHVHWRVPRSLKDLAKLHHHVWSGRIICCEDD